MNKIVLILLFIFSFKKANGQEEFNINGIKQATLEANWPSLEALSFLDTINGYNFYSANEYHRSAMALKQKKAFVSYLKKEKGLDKLVIELPYAYGYWVNKYLETGDTILLHSVTSKWWAYDKLKKNLPISHDSYEFFKWLYSFNNNYDLGIKVVGIDLDEVQHGALELWSVYVLLKNYSIQKYFKKSYPQLEKIKNSDKPSLGSVKKWKKIFDIELKINEERVKKMLGLEYEDLIKINSGISDVIDRYERNDKDRRAHREGVLIRNFKREIKPSDIIYMQFGAGHLFLHNDDLFEHRNFEYLMTAIEGTDIYTGRTLNIYVHCAECELGSNQTAYKPYRLNDNGGYTSHPPIDGFKEVEFHIKLDSLLNNQSSFLDLRNSKGTFSQLSKLFQVLIVVF